MAYETKIAGYCASSTEFPTSLKKLQKKIFLIGFVFFCMLLWKDLNKRIKHRNI